ncbi:MarR family winged helix-turn-helix transcriptional regulator [Planktothrix sp. FACHB-1365]|uniref:MarR family winged helix-turn-helix transcriptional regulator n=1 Tax=Planktothrix sp. FACHB-1365 TaxID=2692855 RepID=UPI0018EFF71B|nr:MarR family winged helix-turn-helix transcriptional regulator [Planktothrix sp. FACHB-1365]
MTALEGRDINGDQGMGLAAVAKGLAVTPATASDAVRVLDEKGLVQKVRSPQDGRAITIAGCGRKTI